MLSKIFLFFAVDGRLALLECSLSSLSGVEAREYFRSHLDSVLLRYMSSNVKATAQSNDMPAKMIHMLSSNAICRSIRLVKHWIFLTFEISNRRTHLEGRSQHS